MLRYDQSKALGWIIRLLQSLNRTHVESVGVDAELVGIDNLPTLMNAARLSRHVGAFDLVNFSNDNAFTVRQVVDLLRDPTALASNKLVVSTYTPASTDYSMLEDYLFSTPNPSLKLRLYKRSESFLDATDTTNVISEFYLVLYDFDDAAFVGLPPTNRMKQFRHNRYGDEVTTRVHTYRNPRTGQLLSAVRHVDDTHDSRILFLKGRFALDDLRNKWTNDKY
ncbi:hypothetical protein AAVH_08928 [Aphelenchoides avenae]|nr:hypothetical protein AAVH_08928 [Aphelenchus avenae]